MDLVAESQVAVLNVDDAILTATGCAADDLEGLINMPLAAQDVKAVIMFKSVGGHLRISLRSKGAIDVRSVAVDHGGGGHKNAAGFTVSQAGPETRQDIVASVIAAVGAPTPDGHLQTG